MRERLNLRMLKVFCTVMESSGVTEAAAKLGVSQPAVSKALGQLEHSLGMRLFGRAHRRLHPTNDAHQLYAESDRLFIQINAFHDRVNSLSSGREGHLIITAIPTLATSIVAHAAAQFGKGRPKVKVQVIAATAADVAEAVGRHRCDLGLVHSPVTDKTVTSEIIGESEIVAVMPVSHPMSKHRSLTPTDLGGEPLILNDMDSPSTHLLYETFVAARVDCHVVMEANNSAVCNIAALAGQGIALIDPWPNHPTPTLGLVLLRYQPRIPLRIALLHSEFQPPSHLAKAFRVDLVTSLREAGRASPFISAF